MARTEFFTPAYLDVEVRLRTAQTPATGWTVPLQWLLVAVAITAIGAAILHNGGFVRPRSRRRNPGEGVA
jgi:apolipoprotein N-acyltransferase